MFVREGGQVPGYGGEKRLDVQTKHTWTKTNAPTLGLEQFSQSRADAKSMRQQNERNRRGQRKIKKNTTGGKWCVPSDGFVWKRGDWKQASGLCAVNVKANNNHKNKAIPGKQSHSGSHL